MKSIRPRTLLALSALLLTAVIVMSPVFAGGGASCGSKATSSNSAFCPPGCCICPEDECGDVCSGAACSWEQSHWKGLKYSSDGQLKKSLTEKQARSVALQYCKKVAAAKGRVVNVTENPDCYNITVEQRDTKHVQKFDISKHTAWIRVLDA